MGQMKLHHLRNVIAIVERGSLRAGAKHLGLAQPAVSRSIKELEQELGVVLFERNKFGMKLTHAGEVLFRRAKAIYAEFDRARAEMEHLKGEDRGVITVGCSSAALIAMMPMIVKRFHVKYPNIRIKLLEGSLPMLESEIRDGIVDLYYGPVAKGFVDPALVIELLFENERMIVGRKGHPLRSATSLADLVGASWVTTPMAIDSDNEVNGVFLAAGLPAPRIVMQASSAMNLAVIVATSDLLAPVPQQWIEIIRATGAMERIPVREVSKAPRICAVRRANIPLTPASEFLNDLAMRAASAYLYRRQQAMERPSIV
ncbi:LysR family transcriptional regulator [Sphingobium jiangsuense]|uniref:DNA-binding transcriptional LysR family regulator n=1 Tax=Sphingobium jiangsuense TaxID=870476 RepID=A0A7W6BH82_9SPHN|nr:LysR substrate-binding domain-containing protein [Sphingobium jiangsuense]MBB3925984.1 DNA-binding transcriptional LysR family regulator [Sphingobium jiangsuense]GLS98917.1 LysR family transcriptional regulator [Sphingobium jiangsuense]